jgi:hypothetical protein
MPAADSLKTLIVGTYSAYLESLNAAQVVGDRVVRDIVAHWPEREVDTPSPSPTPAPK